MEDEKTALDEIDPKQLRGTPEELEIITQVFNSRINTILRFCKEKNPDSQEFETLDSILKEAEKADPVIMIDKCMNKIWASREHIKSCDDRYFLEESFDKYIKPDSNEELIRMLIDLIKSGWKRLYPQEKKVLWQKNRTMLKAVIYFIKWKKASVKE